VRYLPQRLDLLDDRASVAANVARFAPGASDNAVRARLARFLSRGAWLVASHDLPFLRGAGITRWLRLEGRLLPLDPP
jgi:hypothetical protein